MKNVCCSEFAPRKVWMKTFGCQMNYHDSERILYHLDKLNFTLVKSREEADLVIFNTCAIRELANNKFYSQLGEFKKIKLKRPDLIIGICGCVSQIEGAALIKKFKHLDFAFGTDCIDRLPEMICRIDGGERGFHINSWDQSENYSIETEITHNSPQAFVNITKGCNNYCSYCIVPYTRGREKSRSLVEVVDDVRNLVETRGIQEVTLLGQNVNSFGRENRETFPELLARLNEISGLSIIRYVTSHPRDMSDELIKVHGELEKLAGHLHLPVQSGSNSVLKRMNRGYTREYYLDLLFKLRRAKKDIVVSSDIIVGFPNETEAEFQDTMDLLEKAKFDFVFSFCFSPRKGTKAFQMKDMLSNETRSNRLQALQKKQLLIQGNIRKQLRGRTMRILVDGANRMDGVLKWKGRTECNRIVHFEPVGPNDNLRWHWIDVEILSSTALSAQGKLLFDHGPNKSK